MIRLNPLRCIKRTKFNSGSVLEQYEYAPYGTKKALYRIDRWVYSGKWQLWVGGITDSSTMTGIGGNSHNFDYVLKQMHKHYRMVYRNKIEEIVQ